MNRFKDRAVLVTGAASGIGRATSQRFAEEGAQVLCADVDSEGLGETVDSITSRGGVASSQLCDISDIEAVRQTIAAVVNTYNKMDVLVNNAGILDASHFHSYPTERWDRIIAVNLTGTFLVCREAIPHLLETRGNIVNMASSSALSGHPYVAAYASSKGGIISLTSTLAIEYAQSGLRVNAVCPAHIATQMSSVFKLPEGGSVEMLRRHMSLDGTARGPEVVAGVVAFLASEDAANVNGETIRVDGGALS